MRNQASQALARKRIIAKRGNKCEHCGYDGYIELAHINPHRNGGGFDDNNLLLLCEKCHAEFDGIVKRKYLDEKREHWIPS